MEGMQDYQNDENILEKFGRDVTKQVKDGKVDPVIGRDNEIRKIIEETDEHNDEFLEKLLRSMKNNKKLMKKRMRNWN